MGNLFKSLILATKNFFVEFMTGLITLRNCFSRWNVSINKLYTILTEFKDLKEIIDNNNGAEDDETDIFCEQYADLKRFQRLKSIYKESKNSLKDFVRFLTSYIAVWEKI